MRDEILCERVLRSIVRMASSAQTTAANDRYPRRLISADLTDDDLGIAIFGCTEDIHRDCLVVAVGHGAMLVV